MAPDKGFTVAQTPAPRQYTFGQLWQVPLFLLGLAALLTVGATRPLWYDPETARLRRDLATAHSQLQDPHAALNGLTVVLTEALGSIHRLPERAGEAHFLLGSTYLRLAEQVPAERAGDFWDKARTHLEQAEQLGVAETDRPSLLYRLGQAWFHTGGDVPRVIDYVSKTIDQVEDDRAVGYDILTQCYLRLPVPNLAAALQMNEKLLQLPTANESRLIPARLQRGDLLLRLQQREAARKVLARIGADAPPAIQARARCLRARSYQEEGAWAEAAKLWEEVLKDQHHPPTHRSRISYLLGCSYHNLHRAADADRAWSQVAQQDGEEWQAGCLRLANLRVEARNIASALDLYERALRDVHQPSDYRNPLVNLQQATTLLAADCQTCKELGNFEAAEKLARFYTKLAPPGAAQILIGQVTQAWAVAQRARAQQLKDIAAAQREEGGARSHFRDAAAAYQAAAEGAADPAPRSEWLWQAGFCSMQAQDFEHALTAYNDFIDLFINVRPAPPRVSEAWYRRGEAYQALHQDDRAADAYAKCIETGGPFGYRARYQLAMAAKASGHLGQAEDELKQSLDLLAKEPELDREIQEMTLFAYADVLFLQRKFVLAIAPYNQALNLYPASPSAPTALYRLGLCCRYRAEESVRSGDTADSQHPYRSKFAFWLEWAAANFKKLVAELQTRQDAGSLSEADVTLFRQARFALADCYCDLHHYEDAIRLYIGLANEYDQRVEGLIARKKLCFCYIYSMTPEKQLENAKLALHTLELMRQTLTQLDPAAFQGRPETETKAYFEKWLKGQEEELKPFIVRPR